MYIQTCIEHVYIFLLSLLSFIGAPTIKKNNSENIKVSEIFYTNYHRSSQQVQIGILGRDFTINQTGRL